MDIPSFELVEEVSGGAGGKGRQVRLISSSLYVELHLRWLPVEALLEFYQATLELLGSRLTFHHGHRKARASRFRDR